MTWFEETPLGIIFHWGIYSAGARGEWVMNRERWIPEEYFRGMSSAFTAALWDPDQWMELAQEAGAGYVILTTRHHDGYCLWPTETTPWCVGKVGPDRDLVGEFVDSAHRHGLATGLYYSLADWSHPDYPSAWERDWPLSWPDPDQSRTFVQYCRQQIRELLSNYGKIDYLWYDGAFPQPMHGEETNQIARELQPGILLNERNGPPWDIAISEQGVRPKEGLWEAAITLNDNWGYHATDRAWKSVAQVVRTLLDVRSEGGNLLLNVGPRADGTIPEESRQTLRALGHWMSRHGTALRETQRTPFSWNNSVTLIPGPDYIEMYILSELHEDFRLCEFRNRVQRIIDPADGRMISFHQDQQGCLTFAEPPKPKDGLPGALRIEISGELEPLVQRGLHWIPE